jgi:hypothetical protein
MSAKANLKLDNQNILLEIEDVSDCCFELWETGRDKTSVVKVKMSVKTWKKLMQKWESIRGDK